MIQNASLRLVLLAFVLAFGGAVSSLPAQAGKVVELFTSQGCSSCPPADNLLAEIADRRDIVALSFNVDYWDYLGWRDTLARRAFSDRQRTYARVRGDGEVYTPQIVIDGRKHFVGSDRAALKRALSTEAATKISDPRIQVNLDGKVAIIRISGTEPTAQTANVWIATVIPEARVEIKRGENRGKVIIYHNVVRELMPIGVWSGNAAEFRVDTGMILKGSIKACAVLVQSGDGGPIIAAEWVDR